MSADVVERAAAVVVDQGRVLLVLRHRDGRDYAVLPGGGVEPGETVATAAARELEEETSLTAAAGRVLWVREDGGRRATYVEMVEVTGEPRLGGPELERSSADNRYEVAWAGPADLGRLGLQPEAVQPLVHELLTGRPPAPAGPAS